LALTIIQNIKTQGGAMHQAATHYRFCHSIVSDSEEEAEDLSGMEPMPYEAHCHFRFSGALTTVLCLHFILLFVLEEI
jgi:hypothetical protein